MNRDYMANMLFNINDVVETLQGHSINEDIIEEYDESQFEEKPITCLLYTSPSPRDSDTSRMPSSA